MSYSISPNQSSVTLNTGAGVAGSGNVTIGSIGRTIGAGSPWTTATTANWNKPSVAELGDNEGSGQLVLKGPKADVLINEQSLSKTIQAIQDRLAILVPDPKKLEQFEALKQAYEHYKTLEALCCDDTTPKSDK